MTSRAEWIAAFISSMVGLRCGSTGTTTTTPPPCPYYMVAIDAGTDAFSGVGESKGDRTCAQFCVPNYPVCQLVAPTQVKCLQACD